MIRRSGIEARTLILPAIVLSIALFIFGRDAYVDRRLRYELQPSGLVITYPAMLRIPYRDIRGVTSFPVPPAVRGTFLSELGRARIGAFSVEGVGSVEMYSAGIKGPLIVIETSDRKYGLTPATGERFYRDLLARLPKAGTPMSIGPS